MKVAICYLTCIDKDKDISNYIFEQLVNNVYKNKNNKHQYELFKMVNTTDENMINDESHYHTYFFTWDQLKSKYNPNNEYYMNLILAQYRSYIGLCNLPLLYLSDLEPNYDYYIFYEDDLYFTGFQQGINPFDNIDFKNYDIMFENKRFINPSWYWCNIFKYSLPKTWVPFQGLLNCYIISKKSLQDFKEFFCNNTYHGHHELMVNSFFMNQQDKYKISFINNYYKDFIYLYYVELLKDVIYKNIDITNSFVHPIKKNYIMDIIINEINKK